MMCAGAGGGHGGGRDRRGDNAHRAARCRARGRDPVRCLHSLTYPVPYTD